MDPAADMPDQPGRGEHPGLLGPAARAFGKAALIAYWIACLAVIGFGLSQMEWRRPQPTGPSPQAAPALVRPAVPSTRAPHAATAPAPAPRAAQPAPPQEALGLPPASIGALVLMLVGGAILLVRPWRRRDRLGRFSGRRGALVSLNAGRSRRWRG